MALNQKSDKSEPRGRNLILVPTNSDVFAEYALPSGFSRGPSRSQVEYVPPNSNNLFQNFHDPERDRESRARIQSTKKQEEIDDAQKYAQECLEYEKHLFDDKIRLLIHRMAILAYNTFRERKEHTFLSFFIQRMLCAIAKKLLLNKFQLLFLEYVFEESKWKYDIDIISSFSNDFKSFVHFYQSENPHGMINNLQIYLLFCSYYSKKSLNQVFRETIYTSFLKTVSEKFKEHYQEWVQVSGMTKIRINPKVLNHIFKKLTSYHEREREVFDNYNLIVEQILQISPAYNADKDRKTRKKRKAEEEENRGRQPESQNIQEMNQINILPGETSPPEFPTVAFRRRQTSYVSIVDGLDPVAYINNTRPS